MIMNTTIRKFTYFLTACLLGCLTGHAYEQDNWYLHGPLDGNLTGVFHQEYNATARKDMLYKNVTGVGLEVRDINGTLLQTINTGGITFTDIEYDQNTSRLFGINASKLTCFEQNSSGGWSEQWRSTQVVTTMAQAPSGKLFCGNNGNKIYVFEQNGTKSNEFGWVDGINSLGKQANVVGFSSNILVVWGRYYITGGSPSTRFFCFSEYGEFIKTTVLTSDSSWYDSSGSSDGTVIAKINSSGLTFTKYRRRSHYGWQGQAFYNPSSVTPTYSGIEVSLWLENGDFISGSNLYRRTFRTKMETSHNSVPEPVIHRIAQRTGTNVLELDFEVIDTDDDNVTVGILAYCGSDKLVPKAWLNGSGSKIATPIATNTVHTMEWDVKQDWPNNTGSIKFEILCQDGSRDKPVDLHFLKLPFSDGNMTISRSPLKEADFTNYGKFLFATGQAQLESNTSDAVVFPAEANTTEVLTFTNCGQTGRTGPSEAQIQAEYNGTNLQGSVTTGWKAGYQKWTVPATGDYWIEAIGARAGNSNYVGGSGAFIRGKFSLTIGDELNIVVGQVGEDNPGKNDGAAGGGGSFVVADTNNTPLVIAGGGGGPGHTHSWTKITNGQEGVHGGDKAGGTNGAGGQGYYGGGGGGFLTNGSGYSNAFGRSFQHGLTGGYSHHATGKDGGFGGGGALVYDWLHDGGGGGGYSGGGGSNNNSGQGGGGGSYNSGTSQKNIPGFCGGHGLVRIYRAEGVTPTMPQITLLNSSWKTQGAIGKLIFDLGQEYRAASPQEVTKAREAATPGGVNNWSATNQVKPRNLPGNVNEYGFDVSTTSGFWVIKEALPGDVQMVSPGGDSTDFTTKSGERGTFFAQ